MSEMWLHDTATASGGQSGQVEAEDRYMVNATRQALLEMGHLEEYVQMLTTFMSSLTGARTVTDIVVAAGIAEESVAAHDLQDARVRHSGSTPDLPKARTVARCLANRLKPLTLGVGPTPCRTPHRSEPHPLELLRVFDDVSHFSLLRPGSCGNNTKQPIVLSSYHLRQGAVNVGSLFSGIDLLRAALARFPKEPS